MDQDTKRRHIQLGSDIASALERAQVGGDDRIVLLLDAAYAIAAERRWSLTRLIEQASQRWYEQARIGCAASGPRIEIVNVPPGQRH
jgi:hypothetical protein